MANAVAKETSIPAASGRAWRLGIVLLGLVVITLRAPLWLLPGLGRDEAAYALWSHYPNPAYAPLLQILLTLPRWLGAEAAWAWRGPSIVSGALVLVLFERWLAACGAPRAARLLAVTLLAFSPWQTYAGAILHPDDLQLAAIFLFAWAARTGRTRWALVAAALAPWAKPSGLLVTAIALLWSLRTGGRSVRALATQLLVLAIALVPFAFAHAGLMQTFLSFGEMGARSSLLQRLGVLALGVVFLAGPGAWIGWTRGVVLLASSWSTRAPWLDLRTAPDRVLGVTMLAAFVLAALISGQAKGNWLLPGLFLLWPTQLVPSARTRSRWGWATAVGSSLLLSAALSLVLARPDLARSAEERWGQAILPSYLDIAGAREARVASATQWWHRPAEYRSLKAWCSEVWPEHAIDVVVSDDYGLASQASMACPTTVARVVLPLDALLRRPERVAAGALVMAVQCEVADLVGNEGWRALEPVAHPVTGAPVRRALLVEDVLLTNAVAKSATSRSEP